MAVSSALLTYGAGTPPPRSPGTADEKRPGDYWSLAKLKRAYLDYLGAKREEIDEQQQSRRYRHGAHWTSEQIKILNERKQPVVTYNRVGRKIDGIVGLVEKMRQDPKAFPRTPKHEQGAELATAALRYVFDQQDWKAKSPFCAESGAVDGMGGLQVMVKPSQQGAEIELEVVDIDGFFYDPRSFKLDFSDARYMGCGKWVTEDSALELFPNKEDEIKASLNSGADLTSNSDRDDKWFASDGDIKRLRLVDLWYKHKGKWCYAMFTGAHILMEGESYLSDDKGASQNRYVMFSSAVDHDGDRYGFVRNLKSANDEINQRRSKGLHELNSRRIIGEVGAFDDIEKARREAVRPDGVVLRNKGFEAEFDDNVRMANIEGAFKFLEDAKAEVENFGPNPALLGQDAISNRSGRAISLMQQAGIAELGPYILSYRNWKIRVYRAVWWAIQKYWTGERWIRVTDDEGAAQFVAINQLQPHPYGGTQMVNPIGELDVDIILDEGPDYVNAMADLYDTLNQVLPALAKVMSPQQSQAMVGLLIETSPLSMQAKKKFLEASQPDPQAQQMQQQGAVIELQGNAAKVRETQSKTRLNLAKAQEAMTPEPPTIDGSVNEPPEYEVPPEIQNAQALANIEKTRAETEHRQAQTRKTHTDAAMQPMKLQQEQQHDQRQEVMQREQMDRDSAMQQQQAMQQRDDKQMQFAQSERQRQDDNVMRRAEMANAQRQTQQQGEREDRKLDILSRRPAGPTTRK